MAGQGDQQDAAHDMGNHLALLPGNRRVGARRRGAARGGRRVPGSRGPRAGSGRRPGPPWVTAPRPERARRPPSPASLPLCPPRPGELAQGRPRVAGAEPDPRARLPVGAAAADSERCADGPRAARGAPSRCLSPAAAARRRCPVRPCSGALGAGPGRVTLRARCAVLRAAGGARWLWGIRTACPGQRVRGRAGARPGHARRRGFLTGKRPWLQAAASGRPRGDGNVCTGSGVGRRRRTECPRPGEEGPAVHT